MQIQSCGRHAKDSAVTRMEWLSLLVSSERIIRSYFRSSSYPDNDVNGEKYLDRCLRHKIFICFSQEKSRIVLGSCIIYSRIGFVWMIAGSHPGVLLFLRGSWVVSERWRSTENDITLHEIGFLPDKLSNASIELATSFLKLNRRNTTGKPEDETDEICASVIKRQNRAPFFSLFIRMKVRFRGFSSLKK